MKNFLKKVESFIPQDGRWFLGGSHLILCVVSIVFFNFSRSWMQMFLGFSFAILTEIIFFKLTDKYKDGKIGDRIFSAATEAGGLLILVKSGHPFFYGVASVLAVSSKYIFRLNKTQHIYNPTNFAIVVALCFFPITTFNLLGDEFTSSKYPIFHILILGSLAIWRGRTWPVTFAYFATMLVASLVMSVVFKEDFYYWFGPEIGVIGLVFMFLMITDPKTTPKSLGFMFLFGACVALVKIYLKHYEYVYPTFIALMMVTTGRGFVILLSKKKDNPI